MLARTSDAAPDDDGDAHFDKSFQLEFAERRVFRTGIGSGTGMRISAEANRARNAYYRQWQARLASLRSVAFNGRR